MVEMLHTFFSRHFNTYVSTYIVPGAFNAIVDEFARPGMADIVIQHKQAHPDTRIVLLATEFITHMRFCGLDLGNTFNFFSFKQARKELFGLIAHQMKLRQMPPYYVARYRGFAELYPSADLVLCAHHAVADTMDLLPGVIRSQKRRPLTIYPRFDLHRLANDTRLMKRPPGIIMTGTLTKYRAHVGKRVVRVYQHARLNRPIFRHVPFSPASAPKFSEATMNLNYGFDPDTEDADQQHYLFNLNPPQHPKWKFSSPMRIQRAILMGHIPLVTKKFNDHAIETVALVWDDTVLTANRLWSAATFGRERMVKDHLAAVAHYNAIADQTNAAIDEAVEEIV
jgi:hypothetical protein